MIVAVIGHGPSPSGKGWGAQIDACERVIRMWDCHWQAPADYGTRYDVGIFTVWPGELQEFRRGRQRTPAEWWGYDIRGMGRNGHREPLDQPSRLIDTRGWIARARAFGAKGSTGKLEFTRGTVAVLAAIEWLKPQRLHIVGFDTISQGALAWPQYSAAAIGAWEQRKGRAYAFVDDGRERSPTHDYGAERRLILETGTELQWGFA